MTSRPKIKWLTLFAVAGSTMGLVVAFKPQTSGHLSDRPLAIHGPGTPNVGIDLLKAADAAEDAGRDAEAEELSRKALVIRERVLGPDHPALLQPLETLVFSLVARDQFAEAEPPARRLLTIAEKHPEIRAHRIVALALMGWVDLGQSRRDEGDARARKAIELAEAFPGSDQENLSGVLEIWAGVLSKLGRLADALPLFDRSLAIEEANPNGNPEELAEHLTQVGGFAMKLGQFAEAEALLRRALTIIEAHPTIAPKFRVACLNNLGGCCLKQGRSIEAEPLLRQALRYSGLESGSVDPDVVNPLINLAHVVLRNGHRDEAEPLVNQALRIAENGLPPDSLEMDFTLSNASQILAELGYADEALMIGKQALPLREKLHGPESLEVAQILECLIKVEYSRKNWEQAEPSLVRAIAIRDKLALPKDDWLQADVYALAMIYGYQQKYSEAEPLARRTVSLTEQIYGPDSSRLAGCLIFQGRNAECLEHLDQAEPILKRAFAILEKEPDGNEEALVECADLLSWMYLKQGREEDHKAVGVRLNKLPMRNIAIGESFPKLVAVGGLRPGEVPGPPQLIVDGKPVPAFGFSPDELKTPATPPDPFDIGHVFDGMGFSEPRSEKSKVEAKKPLPSYAVPTPIPDVLPDSIPDDPTVQKTSGADKEAAPVPPPPR
jgi:tetratricopeptide (TPR) repeat protein